MKLQLLADLFPAPEPTPPEQPEPLTPLNVALAHFWASTAARQREVAEESATDATNKARQSEAASMEALHRFEMGRTAIRWEQDRKAMVDDVLRLVAEVPGVRDTERALLDIHKTDSDGARRTKALQAIRKLRNLATEVPESELRAFLAETRAAWGLGK